MANFKDVKQLDLKTIIEQETAFRFSKQVLPKCPFCDSGSGSNKTPAFTLYPKTNSFFCYACNEGGNPINFISKLKGISNAEAAKYLEENYGTSRFIDEKEKTENTNSSLSKLIGAIKQNDIQPATEYLSKQRGLDEKKLPEDACFYDSYCNSVIFIDKNEKLINYRNIVGNKKGNKKGSVLKNAFYDKTYRKDCLKVYLTEGVINALSLYSIGYSAIALFSTSNKFDKISLLHNQLSGKEVILAFDPDYPGVKYAQIWIDKLKESAIPAKSVSILNLQGNTDVNDLLRSGKLMAFLSDNKNLKPISIEKNRIDSDIKKIFKPVFKDEVLKDIQIVYKNLLSFFYSMGFRRYDNGLDYIFVRIIDNVISQVSVNHIRDAFLEILEGLPYELGNGVTKEMLIEKFHRNPSQYFNENRFSMLRPKEEIKFVKDEKHIAYVFYKNGFVKITDNDITLKPYSELDGMIWDSQIIDRKFLIMQHDVFQNEGVFKQFVFNIANQDEKRLESLYTIIGYLLHSYYELKLKAVILTDSAINEGAAGRSGKTLLARALGYIRVYFEIPGKDFDPRNPHKYQSLELNTELVHINDARKRFNFEDLFNDISEGLKVEKKNKQPFYLKIKMIVSTNQTISLMDGSSRDRAIEFELSGYYSEHRSPQDDFGHWFFKEWNDQEWLKFDNLMISCLQLYLKKGLVTVASINLEKRKLLEETNEDFVSFMEQICTSGELVMNNTYDKRKIHEMFLERFPDYKEDRVLKRQGNFTKFLKKWAYYTPGINPKPVESVSGKTQQICFHTETKGVG